MTLQGRCGGGGEGCGSDVGGAGGLRGGRPAVRCPWTTKKDKKQRIAPRVGPQRRGEATAAGGGAPRVEVRRGHARAQAQSSPGSRPRLPPPVGQSHPGDVVAPTPERDPPPVMAAARPPAPNAAGNVDVTHTRPQERPGPCAIAVPRPPPPHPRGRGAPARPSPRGGGLPGGLAASRATAEATVSGVCTTVGRGKQASSHRQERVFREGGRPPYWGERPTQRVCVTTTASTVWAPLLSPSWQRSAGAIVLRRGREGGGGSDQAGELAS